MTAEWGGRAMCPRDDYDDPALREEMVWHALEQALIDCYGGPEPLPHLTPALHATWQVAPWMRPELPAETSVELGMRLRATWRVSTDDHLGPDSSGLVDLTCTLTPA